MALAGFEFRGWGDGAIHTTSFRFVRICTIVAGMPDLDTNRKSANGVPPGACYTYTFTCTPQLPAP